MENVNTRQPTTTHGSNWRLNTLEHARTRRHTKCLPTTKALSDNGNVAHSRTVASRYCASFRAHTHTQIHRSAIHTTFQRSRQRCRASFYWVGGDWRTFRVFMLVEVEFEWVRSPVRAVRFRVLPRSSSVFHLGSSRTK